MNDDAQELALSILGLLIFAALIWYLATVKFPQL
jgi:hypothetical protein